MPDTRLNILYSALPLFAEHGFHNVSIRRIAESLSLSTGSLYTHFPKKEDMLDNMVEYFISLAKNYEPGWEEIELACHTRPPDEVIRLFAYDYRTEDQDILLQFQRLAHQEQYWYAPLRNWLMRYITDQTNNMVRALRLLIVLGKIPEPSIDIYLYTRMLIRAIFQLSMEATMCLDRPENLVGLSEEKQGLFDIFIATIHANPRN